MINTVNKNLCTGCGACVNICSQKAIKMIPNNEGFFYPTVDESKCVECGKCLRNCPVVNKDKLHNFDKPDIFALAANDEICMKSSSGGVFTVFAERILKNGGYVCGAAWTKNFEVEHRLVSNNPDLEFLRGTKYVQSNAGNVFPEIKERLEAGQNVMFTGTPCQAAGLRSYLQKEYDNLLIIDTVCHGVPSAKVFREYLRSVLKEVNLSYSGDSLDSIAEVSFRDKKNFGWGHSINIKFKNGDEYNKYRDESAWYRSFLTNLNTRSSCGNCRFAAIPRQGDLTMGDFWSFNKFFPDKDGSKGVSILTVNTEKGKKAFEMVKDNFPLVIPITLDMAKTDNGNLVGSPKSHKSRDRFFDLINEGKNYQTATQNALWQRYDIALAGWWYGKNYGSIMTNFALNRYLAGKGLSVLMLEWPMKSRPFGAVENSIARRLASRYYNISARRTFDEMREINNHCDTFILGSDQLWNYWSTKETDYYFFLNFVEKSKKTIAYSTSFGHRAFNAPEDYLKKASFFMNRIDHISVREFEGVEICRELFGVNAVQTLDPVFICEKSEYFPLIERSKYCNYQNKEKYIFVYILDPTPEKRKAILDLSEQTGMPLKIVLDAQENVMGKRKILNMDDSLIIPEEIDDWLALLYNSQCVVTDSYHGLCFSIIFEKQFACIKNLRRGAVRFDTIAKILSLEKNLTEDPQKICKVLQNHINYGKLNKKLKAKAESSKQWLDEALKSQKLCQTSTYDILYEKICQLESEIKRLKNNYPQEK